MTVAVTGGTGFVGQAVLEEVAKRKTPLRALARRRQEPREGLEWVLGDLDDKAALSDLMKGARAVLHIAGMVNAPDWDGFYQCNVVGTQNVLAAAHKAGVERFICVSSLSAREPGLSDYGKSKRLAEEFVEVSGLDWTIVRPPAIYGPRDREIFELFRAARWGVVPMPPPGRASIIHCGDLARLLLDLLLDDERLSQRKFEPDDGVPGGWTHRDLGRAIGHAMGRKVWVPALPASVLRAGAGLDRLMRGSKAKLTLDRARYISHPDWVCRPERSVPTEIWQPRIETVQGLAETAQWYRHAGWL